MCNKTYAKLNMIYTKKDARSDRIESVLILMGFRSGCKCDCIMYMHARRTDLQLHTYTQIHTYTQFACHPRIFAICITTANNKRVESYLLCPVTARCHNFRHHHILWAIHSFTVVFVFFMRPLRAYVLHTIYYTTIYSILNILYCIRNTNQHTSWFADDMASL